MKKFRFFESCRIRASSGFCVCSLILHLLVAATVGSDVMQTGYSTGNGHLQLGMAIASSLSFCFCQIIYSSLFSGLAIPLPITVTMLTVSFKKDLKIKIRFKGKLAKMEIYIKINMKIRKKDTKVWQKWEVGSFKINHKSLEKTWSFITNMKCIKKNEISKE